MTILHRTGVIIELSSLEKVRPHGINRVNGKLQVELRFNSGMTDVYEDSWIDKVGEDRSIYDIMLSEKIEWRSRIKLT
jgi:hypothetical protein